MTNTKNTTPLKPITETTEASALSRELTGSTMDTRGVVAAWRAMHDKPAAFFQDALGIASKADYLAFREQLKAHLRFFAADQKRLAKLMRQPGGNEDAQWRRAMQAHLVTELIEIRRAGKAWSWAQAEARRGQEAA